MVFDSNAYDELFPREQLSSVKNNADDSMLNDLRTETEKSKEVEDGRSGADEPAA